MITAVDLFAGFGGWTSIDIERVTQFEYDTEWLPEKQS